MQVYGIMIVISVMLVSKMRRGISRCGIFELKICILEEL